MKKALFAAAVLILLTAGMAFANEGVEVEAGVKAWYNEWKREIPGSGSSTSDPAFLLGPAVEVKLPHQLFVEASYLLSLSDYKVSEGGADVEADRKDLDLAFGYQFVKQAGVYLGYKNVAMDVEGGSIDLTGPMLGIRASVPVNETVGIYGNFTYLLTEVEETGAEKEDAPGTIIEAGVKAEFHDKLSVNLGYKIETTKGDESKIKDTFSGITFGALYAF